MSGKGQKKTGTSAAIPYRELHRRRCQNRVARHLNEDLEDCDCHLYTEADASYSAGATCSSQEMKPSLAYRQKTRKTRNQEENKCRQKIVSPPPIMTALMERVIPQNACDREGSFTIALVHTLVALEEVMESMNERIRSDTFSFFLSVDMEGKALGREGTCSTIQLCWNRTEVFVIDLLALGMSAFEHQPDLRSFSLKNVLESTKIKKIAFDMRNDIDALNHIYHVRTARFIDVQIFVLFYLSAKAKYPGAATTFTKRQRIHGARKIAAVQWTMIDAKCEGSVKNAGAKLPVANLAPELQQSTNRVNNDTLVVPDGNLAVCSIQDGVSLYSSANGELLVEPHGGGVSKLAGIDSFVPEGADGYCTVYLPSLSKSLEKNVFLEDPNFRQQQRQQRCSEKIAEACRSWRITKLEIKSRLETYGSAFMLERPISDLVLIYSAQDVPYLYTLYRTMIHKICELRIPEDERSVLFANIRKHTRLRQSCHELPFAQNQRSSSCFVIMECR